MRPGSDCWVLIEDKLENIGLLNRVCGNPEVTVLLAVRYGWRGRVVVDRVGLVAIPTRHLATSQWDAEDPATFGQLNTSLYQSLVSRIPRENHQAIQLTFQPHIFPREGIAECYTCIDDCRDSTNMGYTKDWMVEREKNFEEWYKAYEEWSMKNGTEVNLEIVMRAAARGKQQRSSLSSIPNASRSF